MPDSLEDRYLRAFTSGLIKAGKDAFSRSKQYVPVKTGTLKRSGTFTTLSDGWTIEYDTPYAAIIEYGAPGRWEYVHTHTRSAHKRQVPYYLSMRNEWKAGLAFHSGRPYKRWHKIPEHQVGSYWRYVKERQGQYFLNRAVDEVMNDISSYFSKALNAEFR